ncbi:MAG: ABC-F family ATP-binding cassette domain-containing protein [Eubacteriales bacterium]|nr:ABC-F family ATP-binding cassette domain-containing protein [Eubacterium sp.]MDY5493152.1 ABC-F family ATP-binding cassette domain-containing protein [Eubacteriales bacterium]
MVLLSVSGVTVEYGTDVVLNNINFSINEGDRLGIVGVNGAGKSTLAKIIAGTFTPSSGSVYIAKDKTVSMLAQNAMLESENTVLAEMLDAFPEIVAAERRLGELSASIENHIGGNEAIEKYATLTEDFRKMGGYEYRSRTKSTLARFGFGEDSLDKTINKLSGGERTRLALVKLLLREPDLLILDEPTNHLDMETLAWLEEHLRSYKKTLILISHDRYFLDRAANKILDIEHTEATIYNGNYSAYAAQKAEQRKALAKKHELQQKEISRIEAIIDQQRRWGQAHNFITIKSKQKQIEHLEKDSVSAPKNLPKNISLRFSEARESGSDVLFAENISKSYGERKILSDISFEVKKRDRIMIVGPNGCGKSTLVRILGGLDEDYSGVLRFGYNVIPGYYDQEQQTLDNDSTVLEEVCRAHDKLTMPVVRSALASFLFFAEDMDKKVSVLSGGERARLMLCKMILSQINLLILDEPTNHLDIGSREALEDALMQFSGTIIAVSHDRYFVRKLSSKIFDMTSGLRIFCGSYDEYCEKKEQETVKSTAITQEKTVAESKQSYLDAKKNASDIRKNKSKIERCEAEIEKLEDEKSHLAKEAEGDASGDYVRLSEIYARTDEIDKLLESLYDDIDRAEKALAELGGEK